MEDAITVKKVRLLYDYVIQDIKMKQLNEEIINQDWHTANYHFDPVPMLYLRRFKEVIFSYSIHSPFIKQVLKLWLVLIELSLKTGQIWLNLF